MLASFAELPEVEAQAPISFPEGKFCLGWPGERF
jgi:hypothetical protein